MQKNQTTLPSHHRALLRLVSELISIEELGSNAAKEQIMLLLEAEKMRTALIQAALQFSMPLPQEASIVSTFVAIVYEMPDTIAEVEAAERGQMKHLPSERVEAFIAFFKLLLLYRDAPDQLIQQTERLLEDHTMRLALIEWAKSVWLCKHPFFVAHGVLPRTVDALTEWARTLYHSRLEK